MQNQYVLGTCRFESCHCIHPQEQNDRLQACNRCSNYCMDTKCIILFSELGVCASTDCRYTLVITIAPLPPLTQYALYISEEVSGHPLVNWGRIGHYYLVSPPINKSKEWNGSTWFHPSPTPSWSTGTFKNEYKHMVLLSVNRTCCHPPSIANNGWFGNISSYCWKSHGNMNALPHGLCFFFGSV